MWPANWFAGCVQLWFSIAITKTDRTSVARVVTLVTATAVATTSPDRITRNLLLNLLTMEPPDEMNGTAVPTPWIPSRFDDAATAM